MKKILKQNKILVGFILASTLFLLYSYTYRVNYNDVDIRTVYEDGHKYVVATITNSSSSTISGISIVHSENCPCLKK